MENRKTLHRLGAAGTSSVAHMRAVLLAAVVLLGHSGAGADRHLVSPFDLQHVELHPDSDFYKQAALNEEFMLSISNDELLWTFRRNANLPTPGEPLGGWEAPDCEVRGQFLGHYLSAVAMLQRQTGQPALREKGNALVMDLANVQLALGQGYLSAFPVTHFDRLEALTPVWAPYYVIHKIMQGLIDQYVYADNVLALNTVLDMTRYFEQRTQLTLDVNGTAHWQAMLATEFGGMSEMLQNLYGITNDPAHLRLARLFVRPEFFDPLVAGNDPLAGLHANTYLAQVNSYAADYEKTADPDALKAVQTFYKVVTSHHTFPTGGNNMWEFWGLPDATGEALVKADNGRATEETCTQYNMLKLARYLFTWTGDVAFADYYERAILNGILGTQRTPHEHSHNELSGHSHSRGHFHGHGHDNGDQHAAPDVISVEQDKLSATSRVLLEAGQGIPVLQQSNEHWRDEAFALHGQQTANLSRSNSNLPASNAAGPGVKLYHLPMGAGQTKGDALHGWGSAHDAFWCCYGSSVESFAKLADSIYFFRRPVDKQGNAAAAPAELLVNQFVSSTLTWPEEGLQLNQTASLHASNGTATSTLTVKRLTASNSSHPANATVALKIRVPGWVVPEGSSLTLNSKQWEGCQADGLRANRIGDSLRPSSYCTINRAWSSGDVVEIVYVKQVETQPIQDDRQLFMNTQAVTIGPLVMAGLTHGAHTTLAAPSQANDMVRELPHSDFNSLRVVGRTAPELFLGQDGTQLLLGVARNSGQMLDASFRIVPTLGGETVKDGSHIMLESMGMPGAFASYNLQAGVTSIQQLQTNNSEWRQTFVVRHVATDQPEGSFALALASSPSMFLSEPFTVIEAGAAAEESLAAGSSPSGGARRLARAQSELGDSVPPSQPTPPSPPTPGGGDDPAPKPVIFSSQPVLFEVVEARGTYPEGSCLMAGPDRSYVLSPLSNIVDEAYTVYFEWETAPSPLPAPSTRRPQTTRAPVTSAEPPANAPAPQAEHAGTPPTAVAALGVLAAIVVGAGVVVLAGAATIYMHRRRSMGSTHPDETEERRPLTVPRPDIREATELTPSASFAEADRPRPFGRPPPRDDA